ncbi:hypothetical protein AB5I39_02340 [Sphingomonas sp. MMS24-J45]|uniref:hypothetical protein n=1 Tax=Sphingomonas sp. MMS24-J45 TaxID=3238806 RepID=UPI00384B5DF6
MQLIPAALPDADVRQVATLPQTLADSVRVGPYSEVRKGELLRVVPGVARFHVVAGALSIAIEDGADMEAVDALLHGPVTAALIYQRGEMPLHGAALVPPGADRAIVFVGEKGAGKSTLSYALVQRGWRLMNDDLSRIGFPADAPIVYPGRAAVRLCEDACARFGIATAALPRLDGPSVKYRLPEPADKGEPVPLGQIVEIARSDPSGGLEPLMPAEAISLVMRHSYRPTYLRPMGVAARQFQLAAALARDCAIARLTLAAAPDQLADTLTASYILAT